MIRFLLRVIATLSLSVAVIFAVVDATRSIAASGWLFTPLADAVKMVSTQQLGRMRDAVGDTTVIAGVDVWNGAISPLLALPACAFFAALALLLYLASHAGRRRRRHRFADA